MSEAAYQFQEIARRRYSSTTPTIPNPGLTHVDRIAVYGLALGQLRDSKPLAERNHWQKELEHMETLETKILDALEQEQNPDPAADPEPTPNPYRGDDLARVFFVFCILVLAAAGLVTVIGARLGIPVV